MIKHICKAPLVILPLALCLSTAAHPAQRFPNLRPLPPLFSRQAATVPPAGGTDAVTIAASDPGKILYSGDHSPKNSGIVLSSWGAGSIADSEKLTVSGSHSLLLTTLDSYQGGVITFTTPVSLGDLSSKMTFLQMTMHFPQAVLTTPSAADGGAQRKENKKYNPFAPPVVTTLRWVFTLSDGRQAEIRRPLPDRAVFGNEWFNVAVPLSALRFTTPAAGAAASDSLTSIMIAANGYAQFTVGSIQLVTDSTPITASAGEPQYVNAGDDVVLHAQADAGPSALRYEWDFDTEGAFVDQAEGETVSVPYDTGGKDYTVTLRVFDRDGIKAPLTATTVIHVQ